MTLTPLSSDLKKVRGRSDHFIPGLAIFFLLCIGLCSVKCEIEGLIDQIKANSIDLCLEREPRHLEQKIWVMMKAWNSSHFLNAALENLYSQDYKNLEVLVFIDYSGDDEFKDDRAWKERMNIHFFRPRASRKVGVTIATWTLIQEIRSRAGANDLVLYMDGDDLLMGHDVLRELNSHFLETKAWFVWGRKDGPFKEECKDLNDAMKGPDPNFRTKHWEGFRFCHPRMFKAFLLNYFEEKHFKVNSTIDSDWLPQFPDIVLVYRILELSGPDRVSFYGNRETYLYRYNSQSLHQKVHFEKRMQVREAINRLEKATPLPKVIHVCTCVFDRPNTHSWLIHHMRHGLKGVKVAFHICVNNRTRMMEFMEISDYLAPQFPDATIHWYPMATNVAGFGRFLVMKQAMKKMYVDYWVVLDDDVLANVTEIYSHAKPLSYQADAVRLWEKHKYQFGQDDMEEKPRYWNPEQKPVWIEPTFTMGLLRTSIVDSAVVLDERLYKWDPQTLFGWEDMWLSYVVKSRGWWMGRLHLRYFMQIESLSRTGMYITLHQTKQVVFEALNSCPFSFLHGLLGK